MADVFLSYVREDHVVAEKLARGLEDAGLSVWWDRHIHAGLDFTEAIEREITAAKSVVVLWSATSNGSKWVRDEAGYARDNNKLIPVQLDAVAPPFGFRQVLSVPFEGWNGNTDAATFRTLVEAVRHLLGETGPAAPASPLDEPNRRPLPKPQRGFRKRWVASAIAVLVVLVGAIALKWRAPSSSVEGTGVVQIGDFQLLTGGEESALLAKNLTDTLARVFATNGIRTVGSVGGADSAKPEFHLRGSIQQSSGRFLVGAEVVHSGDDSILWSASLERDVAEMHWFPESISVRVADVLHCAIRMRRRQYNADSSPELFGSLLRFCDSRSDPGSRRGIDLARRLLDAYPEYAGAHAACAGAAAFASAFRASLNTAEETARLRKTATECANTTIAMNPRIGGAHWAMAIVDDPNRGLAEREQLLQKSLDVDPEFLTAANTYGNFLIGVGRWREARLAFERVTGGYTMADPGASTLVMLMFAQGDRDAARAEFDRVDHIWPDPGAKEARFIAEHWWGDPAITRSLEGDERVKRLIANAGGADPAQCLRVFLDARANDVRLSERDIAVGCAAGFHLEPESIYAYFGHTDAAYREIEKRFQSYARKGIFFNWRGNLFQPHLRSVRADSRFMSLAARVGLVDYWLETDQWPDFCASESPPYDCKEAALATRRTTSS